MSMAFVFTRIDDRYVHGQVGARIVKQFDVQKICIIDDQIAADDFMKNIYIFSGNACGAAVEIYSVKEAKEAFDSEKFKNVRYLLLFGNIDTAYRALMAGIRYPELDVASIKLKRGETKKQATNYVYIDEEDARKLREIVAQGTPEEVAKVEKSYTGKYLKKMLNN